MRTCRQYADGWVLPLIALLLVGSSCARVGFGGVTEPASDGQSVDSHGPADAHTMDQPLHGDAVFPMDKSVPIGDVLPLDLTGTSDLKPPGLDAPVQKPCLYGVLASTYPGGKMVICHNPGNAFNLCKIGQVCNATEGWQLCPPAEYLANGGATIPQALLAWLGGCVRDKGILSAPAAAICSSCVQTQAAQADVAWTCSLTAESPSNAAFLGLITSATCNRVGVNTLATAGFWATGAVSATRTFVVCCKK